MEHTVFNWLWENRQWVFSGAGVSLIPLTAMVIGKLRRSRAKPESTTTSIVVQIDGAPFSTTPPGNEASRPVRIDRIAPINPDDVHNAIANAMPLQEAAIKQSYVGLKVEWDTVLLGAEETDGGIVRLHMEAESRPMFIIFCNVKLDDYRELGITPKGSRIRLYGEIEEAAMWHVNLKDVELKFLDGKRS